MSTGTIPLRRAAPTAGERLLLWSAHRVERFTLAHMVRRMARRTPGYERVRARADDRRRSALALGGIGILPRG